jgi:hypothetical protein
MGKMGIETANRLIWGFFLIAVGAMLLAVNLGMEFPHGVWNYWPFLVIAMGLGKVLFGRDREGSGGGFWLVLGGLYGWISIWHVWDLSWATAWPIFVIAGGLSVLLQRSERRGPGDASARGGDRLVDEGREKEVEHVG